MGKSEEKRARTRVAVTGGGGFIGQQIINYLRERDYDTVRISRPVVAEGGQALQELLQGVAVVIHLAGAPIIRPWTRSYRQKIYDSRIRSTRNLVQAMEVARPGVFICASAVGLYPGKGIFTEKDTQIAEGFLAEVVRDWEYQAMKAAVFTRVLCFRFGMVLGRHGGALKTMGLPFRLGLGGRIGSGRQMISWVHADDVTRAVAFAIKDNSLSGPVNITAPSPVSNKTFTKILAKTLNRPAIIPIPAFLIRMVYGGAASVLTKGQTAIPEKLMQSGFQFRYPELHQALQAIFGKTRQKKML